MRVGVRRGGWKGVRDGWVGGREGGRDSSLWMSHIEPHVKLHCECIDGW